MHVGTHTLTHSLTRHRLGDSQGNYNISSDAIVQTEESDSPIFWMIG